jgi:anthranilate synthase component 1
MNIQTLFSNPVPIRTFSRQLLADMDTPVSSYFKLNSGVHSFLLESMEGDSSMSRYSIIGLNPLLLVKRIEDKTEIIDPATAQKVVLDGNIFEHIESLLKAFKFDCTPEFECGFLCGYLSYDTIRYIEKIPATTRNDLQLPEMYLILPSEVILFDNRTHTMKIIVHLEENDEPVALEKLAEERLEKLLDKFSRHAPKIRELKSREKSRDTNYITNISKEDFEKNVEHAKDYIRNGDIFQVVLSRRMQTEINCDSFDIYRMLHLINPSPYMYYLNLEGLKIIGSSPEIMVRYDGNRVLVRPIAGTRKRGKCLKEDQEIAAELLTNEKERAEHVMLVDLGRNDIGRVAIYGSVRRDSYMQIENYSHVMHIVSTVSGKLRPELDAVDVFKACFPAGTVSGAPKVRAMEIIDELETTHRGPYAGAVGYFDFQGRMDTAIAIRTIFVKDKTAYWQAGAGIVADSDPKFEYHETENKAGALLKAITLAEENSDDRHNR